MKRALDLLVSGLGLLIMAPFFAVTAGLIKLGSSGPVFYRGVRIGRNGKTFRIFKFRTMVQNADQMGGASTPVGDQRVTGMGRWLRRYKLDEFPQFLNVLRGEMSLVGPRPQVPWAVERYSEEERAILGILPGITDFASLRFRDEGEILRGSADPDQAYFEKIHPEKMRLSLQYLHQQSFLLDCKIIWQTVMAVATGRPPAMLEAKTADERVPGIPR